MELAKKAKEYFSKDVNISYFCVKANMSRSTFLRRLYKPETFKASEIQIIKEITGVSDVFKKVK